MPFSALILLIYLIQVITADFPASSDGASQSSFSCRGRPAGYYADMDLDCKAYHLCNRHGGGMAFRCPEGTRFQQRTMVCHHANQVNCTLSPRYFEANLRIGHKHLRLIDDTQVIPSGAFMQLMVKEDKPEQEKPTQHPVRKKHRPPPVSPRKKESLPPRQHRQHLDLRRRRKHRRGPTEKQVKQKISPATPSAGLLLKPPILESPKPSRASRFQTRRKASKKPAFLQLILEDPYADVRQANNKKLREVTQSQKVSSGLGNDLIFNEVELFSQQDNRDTRRVIPGLAVLQQPLPQVLEPPKVDAPFSNYSRLSQPLLAMLPKHSRVVGVAKPAGQPMSLAHFLNSLPSLGKKGGSLTAVPVPVSRREAKMIQRLIRSNHTLSAPERANLLGELEKLVKRQKSQQPTVVRPRGGATTISFFSGSHGRRERKKPAKRFFPSLEFGFVPITTTSTTTTTTTTTIATTSLATTPAKQDEEAFFFTTTPAPPPRASKLTALSLASDSNELLAPGLASDPFDMRNLFFIPSEKGRKSSLRKP